MWLCKTITLDEELSANIVEYCSMHNITPHSLFLASMSAYTRCKKGIEKCFIGTTCSTRVGAHERSMVGLFYSILPVYIDIDPADSFADTVTAVSTANYASMRHQGANYDTSNPSPYVYIASYQNAVINADPTAVCTQYYSNYLSYCMLTAEDREQNGRFRLHLDYNLELFPSDQEMDELLDYVTTVLREGVANDEKPIGQLGA